MGLMEWLGLVEPSTHLPRLSRPVSLGGTGWSAMTRERAMGVPALSRARDIIVGAIAPLPLVVRDDLGQARTESWAHRTDCTPPQYRLAWTVDDLIFYGESLWEGTKRQRVPYGQWWQDDDGTIMVERATGERRPARSPLLIQSIQDGVLSTSVRKNIIQAAANVDAAAARRGSWIAPLVTLEDEGDLNLTDDEIEDVRQHYIQARRDPDGAVAWIPNGVKLGLHSAPAEDNIQGRNGMAVDIARLMNVPAILIDASGVNSTLTYQTTQGTVLLFHQQTIEPIITSIEARLSMDDSVPAGWKVSLDRTNLTAALGLPEGPARKD